jgi:hypothetical protein
MVWVISGQLEATSEGVTLAGCRVDVAFDRYVLDREPLAEPSAGGDGEGAAALIARHATSAEDLAPRDAVAERAANERSNPVATAQPATVPVQLSARTNATGRFQLQLPDKEEIASETMRFTVSAPSGQTLGDDDVNVGRIRDLVRLRVRKVTSIVVKPTTPAEPTSYRVTGRVIERNGKPLPATLQVLLFARQGADRDDAEAGPPPVLAARADTSGYFSGVVPADRFDRAAALVSGVADEIPVPLEDRRIPQKILLVCAFPQTADPAAAPQDCNCPDTSTTPRAPSQSDIANAPDVYSVDLGTGRCVQFNTPNRSIEEFDFYSVVRTTEPAIRGLTMESHDGERNSRANMWRPMSGPESGLQKLPGSGIGEVVSSSSAMLAATPVEGSSGTTGTLPPPPPLSGTGTVGPPPGTGTGTAPPPGTSSGQPPPGEPTYGGTYVRPVGLDSNRHVTFPFGRPPGRAELNATTPVDWDATPTFYEAATIAHGHLLHFKQVWYADGYSLGDLLYSLPLAPGQKKLVSVVDWERRERRPGSKTPRPPRASTRRCRGIGIWARWWLAR